jgi:type VI secretion system secreted protein VgrG
MARSIRPSVLRRSAAAVGLATVLALSVGLAAHADTIIDGPVNLREAADFGVLGDETVTNTGLTVVDGDVGLSPGTSVTGFTEGPGTIENGSLYINDEVAANGQRDASIAYEVARSLTPQESGITQLDGRSLSPGVYSGGAVDLAENGDLAFAGSAASVWVIQASSSLTIGKATEMTFSGGASACNVFWQVGSSATIGETILFAGTILAQQSISTTAGATVEGRLLALEGAVTLDTTDITVPEACPTVGTPVVVEPTPTGSPTATPGPSETPAPTDGPSPSESPAPSENPVPTPSSPTDTDDGTGGSGGGGSADGSGDGGSGGGSGDGGSGDSSEPLAVTGSDTSAPAVAGALVLLAGIALTVAASRQRRAIRSAR